MAFFVGPRGGHLGDSCPGMEGTMAKNMCSGQNKNPNRRWIPIECILAIAGQRARQIPDPAAAAPVQDTAAQQVPDHGKCQDRGEHLDLHGRSHHRAWALEAVLGHDGGLDLLDGRHEERHLHHAALLFQRNNMAPQCQCVGFTTPLLLL